MATPVDDTATSNKFRQLSKETKLIFISNVPDLEGAKGDYYLLVSTNERAKRAATEPYCLGTF